MAFGFCPISPRPTGIASAGAAVLVVVESGRNRQKEIRSDQAALAPLQGTRQTGQRMHTLLRLRIRLGLAPALVSVRDVQGDPENFRF